MYEKALVYVGAAVAAAGATPAAVLIAAACVLAHVVGLTYAAKQEALDRVERLWPVAVLALPLLVALPWMGAGWIFVVAWLALAAVDLASVRLLKERRAPGAVPRAVATLIAGISLVDAVFVASVAPWLALPCWAGFVLTRALQRVVPGT